MSWRVWNWCEKNFERAIRPDVWPYAVDGTLKSKHQLTTLPLPNIFVSDAVQLISLVTFPVKFLEEISDRPEAHWHFGWAYGIGWGAAIFIFIAGLLLLIDKGAEEVVYREVTAKKEGLEEEAVEAVWTPRPFCFDRMGNAVIIWPCPWPWPPIVCGRVLVWFEDVTWRWRGLGLLVWPLWATSRCVRAVVPVLLRVLTSGGRIWHETSGLCLNKGWYQKSGHSMKRTPRAPSLIKGWYQKSGQRPSM